MISQEKLVKIRFLTCYLRKIYVVLIKFVYYNSMHTEAINDRPITTKGSFHHIDWGFIGVGIAVVLAIIILSIVFSHII